MKRGQRYSETCGGFTLIEVLAALAILGVALFVLMDAHFNALSIYSTMDEEVTSRKLLEDAVYLAEMEVYGGNLSGGEEFGTRYPGYAWSFEATKQGVEEEILLYTVSVEVTGPDGEQSLEFLVYNPGVEELKLNRL